MRIKMAVTGVVFAVLGLVACAGVVDEPASGDDLAERAASEATLESGLELRDQEQLVPTTTCQRDCSKAYIACARHSDEPEACLADLQACLLDCML